MTAFITAADGTRLAYRDEGAGPVVLCLAGLTRNMRDFDHVAPHLPQVRLIRMDYRGRGLSDRADPASYTVAQEAADALALLDHLGIARAAVLGTSRGGLVGLWLAATARERLAGLALNDIGPAIGARGARAVRGLSGAAAGAGDLGRGGASAGRSLDGVPRGAARALAGRGAGAFRGARRRALSAL